MYGGLGQYQIATLVQELFLKSCQFTLPESFMETYAVSVHGRLVHVIFWMYILSLKMVLLLL